MTYITFKLQNEIFAAKVGIVLEVLLDYTISEVPDAPEYIEGVINYRGEIIPIVDFRKKLMFPDNEKNNQIVIFDISEQDKNILFGAKVDKVNQVFETDEIQNRPEFGSRYNPEYIEGMIKQNDDFIMILDIKKIFNDTEIQIIKQLTVNN